MPVGTSFGLGAALIYAKSYCVVNLRVSVMSFLNSFFVTHTSIFSYDTSIFSYDHTSLAYILFRYQLISITIVTLTYYIASVDNP